MIIPRAIEIAIATVSSTASHDATCDDLHHCRTIASVIFSCASTIFLCTWVSVHPDVPKESNDGEEGSNDGEEAWWKKLFKRRGFSETLEIWSDELQTRRIILMIPAFLAPEAILTWAFIQWIKCCKGLKETLDKNSTCKWTETHGMLVVMNGLETISEDDRERCEELPLDRGDVLMPSEAKIRDRGKGDNVAKTITLIQTLWFAIQVAHRVSQGLDVTELELTTLGHVVLNAFIYWCWWNKPLCIGFPVEVRKKKMAEERDEGEGGMREVEQSSEAAELREREDSGAPAPSIRVRLGAYIKERTENFRESEGRRERWFLAGLGCIIGGLFGMVHCLAWNSTFPTHVEQSIWRVCALIVTLAPGLSIVILFALSELDIDILLAISQFTITAPMVLSILGVDIESLVPSIVIAVEITLGVTYCISRICLLVLALMALRDLPYNALESPSWSIYIPHIA